MGGVQRGRRGRHPTGVRIRRRGWGLLATAAVAIGLGRAAGLFEVFLLGAAAAALVLVCGLWVALRRFRVATVRSLHPDVIPAGSTATAELRLSNTGSRSTPVLRLDDPVGHGEGARLLVAAVAGRSQVDTAYRIPTRHRGPIAVGPLRIVHSDPFGLTERVVPSAPATVLTVLPPIDAIAPMTHTSTPDVEGRRHSGTLARRGEDFAALRPYVVGDDLRRVHWPSSARSPDNLLVRQDDVPWQDRITVLLDVRPAIYPDRASFERAVSAAASVVDAHVARGDRVRLATTAGDDLGDGSGGHHRLRMLEHLAIVEPATGATLADAVDAAARHRPGAIVVVTGAVRDDDVELCHRRLGGIPQRRLVAFGSDASGRGRTEVIAVDRATTFVDAWSRSAVPGRRARRRGRP